MIDAEERNAVFKVMMCVLSILGRTSYTVTVYNYMCINFLGIDTVADWLILKTYIVTLLHCYWLTYIETIATLSVVDFHQIHCYIATYIVTDQLSSKLRGRRQSEKRAAKNKVLWSFNPHNHHYRSHHHHQNHHHHYQAYSHHGSTYVLW